MYLTVTSERLRIRPVSPEDAAFMYSLLNSEGWLKFIGNRNIANEQDARAYIQKLMANPAIFYSVLELKEGNQPLGVVTLLQRDYLAYPDIGFALLPAYEKKGYAEEACRRYLQEMLASRRYANVLAIVMPENLGSVRLLEKLGLRYRYSFEQEAHTLSLFSLKPDVPMPAAQQV